jgi:hypothetical protein
MFDCQVLNTPFDAIFLSVAQTASFASINNSPPNPLLTTTQQDENNNNPLSNLNKKIGSSK